MNLDDVARPESSTAGAVLEVATAYCSPALLNHCLRSYVWAASYGLDISERDPDRWPPASSAAAAVESGIAGRIEAKVLERAVPRR